MNDIHLGRKIRQLRRKKGITQEALAQALSVTAQAVSKWEMATSYPDITMLPLLASYFEVSFDTLFDYDLNAVKAKIQTIMDDAWEYFFSDPMRYAETMKQALCEYPDNEALLSALLNAYEYDLRENGSQEHLDEMIELSRKIISESDDFVRVCSVKDVQAAAYLQKGEYAKAKEVLETLPDGVLQKNDAMAFRLSGTDKRNAAIWARCGHLQDLYIACNHEGDAEYSLGRYAEALIAYTRGVLTIEAFLIPDRSGEDAYLWAGMQTFHWLFHQRKAACCKKLGMLESCEAEILAAKEILQAGWHDFAQRRAYYLQPFNHYLAEYDLAEYAE